MDFIDECEKQNYFKMTGTLALALSNYLMRDISIRKSFINDKYTPEAICESLDAIFSLREKEKNFSFFIKKMFSNLVRSEFLYMEKKQVLICTTGCGEKQENISDLANFVLSLEG